MDFEFSEEQKAFAKEVAAFIAENDDIDVAVLDVTLQNGTTCLPVAEELERLGIPYLLHSGDLNRHDETVRKLGARHIPKPADANFVIRQAVELSDIDEPEGERASG